MKTLLLASFTGSLCLASPASVVGFQEDAGTWSGTVDRVVGADGSAAEGSSVATYFLDGDPEVSGEEAADRNLLLRFDGIFGAAADQIPPGAAILSAKLVLRTAENPSGGPYVVGRLTAAFDGTTTYAGLGAPGFPGARAAVARPVAAGFVDMKAGEVVAADLTAIVRAWAGGAPNHGVAVYSSFTDDSWEIASSAHPRVGWRPRLVVEFSTDPVAAHAFPATESALLDSTPGDPTLDGATLGEAALDADPGDIREALFKFGGLFGEGPGQVAAGERIVKAELVLTTVQKSELLIPTADSFDVFGVFPMATGWDLVDGNADGFPDLDFGASGPTMAGGDIECAVAEFSGMGQDAEARADITELVRAWRNGKPNHGVNIKMTSAGADSWYISWPGTAGAHAPRLEILTVTTPADPDPGTAEFRDGVGGYAGTFQKRIDLGDGGRLGSEFTSYLLDGNPPAEDANDLLRFDGIVGPGPGQVPADATVLSAGLYYTTGGDSSSSASAGPFTVGALSTAVSAATDYSELAGVGPGMEGVRGSLGKRVGGFGDMLPGEEHRAEVSSIVQDWVNGGANHGFGIFASETTDAWEVTTLCDVIERRPRLRIDYTTAPVNRLGMTADTVAILRSDDLTEDGAAFGFGLLDGDPENQLLLGFDNLIGGGPAQLSPAAEVLKAWLVLDTGPLSFDDSSGPFAVRGMTTAWSLATVFSDFGIDGPTESGGQTGPALGRFRGAGLDSECRVDITALVKSWQSGGANHGLVVQAETTNGWWVRMPGGGPARAPRVEIITAAAAASGFDDWAVAAGLPGLSREDDRDRDGIPALVEYGLGTDPENFDALPSIVISGGMAGLSFNKGAEAAADPGILYEIHRSIDLEEWEKVEGAVDTATTIGVSLPVADKLFLRLRVTEP